MNSLTTQTRGTMLSMPGGAPIGVQILLNPELTERCKEMAKYLANARGFVPPHLENNAYACFAVVIRSLTWQLDPYSVAASTYTTPGGSVGYEGKLVQAALENSGRLEGGVSFELYGPWKNIKGRFKEATSKKGNKILVPDWKPEDEKGLGVRVSAQVKGEAEPRILDFDLNTAHPRNSVLWATRPDQQIKYAAVRAFANTCLPAIFMGVRFDFDEAETMVDVTDHGTHTLGETDPLPGDLKAQGREDFKAGVKFRDAPQHLTPEQYDEWAEGWQEEERALHEGESSTPTEEDDENEEDSQTVEDTGESDPPTGSTETDDTSAKKAGSDAKKAGASPPPASDETASDPEPDGKSEDKKAAKAKDEPEQGSLDVGDDGPDHEAISAEIVSHLKSAPNPDALDKVLDDYDQQIRNLPDGELYDNVNHAYNECKKAFGKK